ncbi:MULTISPECIES: hypothetical protein [unclassified Nostoc]|uniref:hypothetical protein n=1 Tax=unclassified Nostoc TaxID=2593658 RepID=UPI002612A526|nr:hypothetical protein [Nostoc sp. S13]MDF5737871.1 hypothetical protein [Nostoc sp. S13]
MKCKQFVLGLLLTGAIAVLVTEPTRSDDISSLRVHKSTVSTNANEDFTQQTRLITKEQIVEPILTNSASK